MVYLRLAIDTPLRRTFDYLPPAEGAPAGGWQPGLRLAVPFGRGEAVGVLLEAVGTTEVPAAKLRQVLATLDTEPVLDAVTLGLLRWAADYYHHPVGEVFAAALPVLLRQGRAAQTDRRRWWLTDTGAAALEGTTSPPARLGKRQREALELLRAQTAGLTLEHYTALAPALRTALRDAVERDWAQLAEAAAAAPRESAGPAVLPPAGTQRPEPTTAQAAALAAIAAAGPGFHAFLLEGVTGSGKTEVYLRLLEQVLASGQQGLVLVPEIGLTPQLVDRFRARLGGRLAVLHSALTDSERLAAWREAREGRVSVVIGTRSAVFTPLERLGLVIVDEEHDGSYKQQDGWRYSARDLAVIRAQRAGVPVVLGSATPALETLWNAQQGRYQLLTMPVRAGAAGAPRLGLVDLRREPQYQGLATASVLAIQRHLAAGNQVLLYLNRRGFAPTLFCNSCGWTAPCRRCDARMTVHSRPAGLTCHHCGLEATLPFACPTCSHELSPVGQGTERIEQLLADQFPGTEVLRIDRDTIRRRGELDAALERVREGHARILVGTQMLAKGHDFPEVTLVVVLNADQGLFGTDFRAAERLAQTLTQVAGRAGRAERPGEVLIQTTFPDHPLLARWLEGGYDAFATVALEERAAAGWPPYSKLAVLRAESEDEGAALAFLRAARDAANALGIQGVRLLGPAPAVMERRAGRFRAQLLLECPQRGPLHQLLAAWLPLVDALPRPRRVRCALDVDPVEVA
jgi:primosomal protein N' (replication factor Y)